jgi:hypothetical protein
LNSKEWFDKVRTKLINFNGRKVLIISKKQELTVVTLFCGFLQ